MIPICGVDMSAFFRFSKKIELSQSCWNWTAMKNHRGYGEFRLSGKLLRAHRYSFELFKGTVPKSLFVCHSCDNPSCVNPDHLWVGTNLDNSIDCVKKGRHVHLKKTTCPRGHPYSGHNLIIHKGGGRRCRECAKKCSMEWRMENKLKKKMMDVE